MLEKLRKTRKEMNIPILELCAILNTRYEVTYYKKERGEIPFKLLEAYLISKRYGIPIEFFLPIN